VKCASEPGYPLRNAVDIACVKAALDAEVASCPPPTAAMKSRSRMDGHTRRFGRTYRGFDALETGSIRFISCAASVRRWPVAGATAAGRGVRLLIWTCRRKLLRLPGTWKGSRAASTGKDCTHCRSDLNRGRTVEQSAGDRRGRCPGSKVTRFDGRTIKPFESAAFRQRG